MKFHGFIVLGFSFFLVSCSWMPWVRTELPIHAEEHDFVSLFEDENLAHWVVMGNPQGFQVVDGVIRSEGGTGGNWLRSKKLYSHFMLRLDYRVSPGGNSGVFIRCKDEGNPWETGFECQISNEQPRRDDLHCTGSLYGYVPANPRPDESPDVWHQLEILCKGSRILVFVDGVNTVNVDQTKVSSIQDKPLIGYIGLQDSHSETGHWVEFRNISIKEFPYFTYGNLDES